MEIPSSIFDSFPVLKTQRLLLRAIERSDALQIFQMRANGRLNQFIARDNMNSPDQAGALVEKIENAFTTKTAIGWAGVLRGSGDIIGTCGFNSIDFQNLHAEIGGELSVAYWGKNIAQEAVAAIVNFGLENMNLHTIEAKVSPENRGAIFLLENLGFRKEAHFSERVYFRGKFSDMAVYSLINKSA